ncbi:hypothetical protein CK516_00010 [Nostoc sp. 'Peltigera malacea cyanobiont' DB3992]|nr:hypothetical protein CK516_00010 [Nostoc sp. 'Peltigera malacea cyanobiont' DB3992]
MRGQGAGGRGQGARGREQRRQRGRGAEEAEGQGGILEIAKSSRKYATLKILPLLRVPLRFG